MFQGMMVNYSLMMLSKCVRELVDVRRKRQPFEHLCRNPLNGDLVALLDGSLTGSAFTAIFICVSQAPSNAQQSRFALEFGEVFSRLTMDRLQPMPRMSMKKLRHNAKACLAENESTLSSARAGKYTVRRQAMARDSLAQLAVLEQLSQPK